MRIRWLRSAIRDLNALADYLAQDDQEFAQHMYAEIRQQCDSLCDFPEKERPGRISGTKELVLVKYQYVIPYRVKNNVVEILRIFHTRQKPPERYLN